MKNVIFITNEAVASHCGAMEADTISIINGRSWKSHMRKVNFLRKACLLSVLCSFVLTCTCFAQDVIITKDSRRINAKVTEVNLDNVKYKIFDNQDGPTFTIMKNDIVSILYQDGNVEVIESRGGTGLQSGYKGIVQSGFLFGIGEYGMNRFTLDFINTYQINPYFSFGLGIGARNYYDFNAPVLIPIFADFRVNFIDNLTSPYLSLGVGYSFDATNSFKKVGFFLNPTVGVTIMIPRNHSINVGVGYEMQRMNFFVTDWRNYYVFTKNSGAINLVLSLSF